MKKFITTLTFILAIIILPKSVYAITSLDDVIKDGKLEVPSVAPTNFGEYYDFIGNYLMELDGVETAYPSNANADYTVADIDIDYKNGTSESRSAVQIVYTGGDSTIKTKLEQFASKFVMGQTFLVKDLEIINYLANIDNSNSFEEVRNVMLNYSSEFRELMGNTNVKLSLNTPTGMGDAGTLFEAHLGDSVISYKGIAYATTMALGVRVEHIIYVADGTTNLKTAAQERIDNYIGSGKFTVTDGGTVDSLYTDPADKDNDFSELGIDATSVENYYNLSNGTETIPVLIIADSSKMTNPSYLSKDLDSNILISSENHNVPLDTQVSANKLSSGDKYNKIIQVLDVTDNVTYDLELYSKTLERNITKLENGKFLVRIPLPDTLKGKENLTVYFVKSDNSIEEHTPTIGTDYIEFETDHFSIYTVAESKNTQTSSTEGATESTSEPITNKINNPETLDNILIYFEVSLMSLLGLGIIYKKIKTN
ncbi:MAG: hypothetical protein IKX00_05235 [Bacilli bacterium]|nr:hypothetical protein [Bacilli bacterium]